MGRLSGYYCLLLICSWYQLCMGNPFLVAFEVGEKAVALYDAAKSFKQAFTPEEFEASNNQIYEELKSLRSDFSNFKSEMMHKISQDLKSRLNDAAEKFFDRVKEIHSQYEKYLEFSGAPPGKYEDPTIHGFANNSVTSSLVELPRRIEELEERFIDEDIERQNLISIIARNGTASDLMCLKHESKQQLINDLHQIYVKSSIKGLIVVLYSYEVKAKFEERKYKAEKELAIELFTNRSNTVSKYVKNALKISSREVWTCDPNEYRKGETYDKLQEVFQSYVFLESDSKRLADFGQDIFSQLVVRQTAFSLNHCSDMGDERLTCNSNVCKSQPEKKRCNGHIRDCQDMPTSQICHAPDNSDRRYDWMRLDEKDNYAHWGRNRFYSHCDNTQGVHRGSSHLDVCACTCESENILHDRHFSLHSVLSDVGDNKVVTGIKLVKQYHVFQIQIEQGTLGPNGTIIDQPTWKEFKSFSRSDLYDPKVAVPKLAENWNPYYYKYEESVEYHKNDVVYTVKHGQNHVYLDTLDSDPDRVVTGLKFGHDDDSLKLEIQVTEFDYATGSLRPHTSSWKSKDSKIKNRKELTLVEPDDPTKVNGPNRVLSTDNQYVDFTTTDLDRDFGQYTVPFFDFQHVTTTPRMPLSGAGLILKGQEHSGGFLAFKVIHYDYTNHL